MKILELFENIVNNAFENAFIMKIDQNNIIF